MKPHRVVKKDPMTKYIVLKLIFYNQDLHVRQFKITFSAISQKSFITFHIEHYFAFCIAGIVQQAHKIALINNIYKKNS